MGKIVEVKFTTIDDEIIERDRLFNVYVLSLPRSGSSMMTHILELLGVSMVHTSENDKEKTDERFKNKYGEYHANPTGFYEITENHFENWLNVLSTPYAGCKIILPLRDFRLEIVKNYPSKVIMMVRDVEEIRQSQMAYYRKGDVDIAYLRTALAAEKLKLEKQGIDHMIVDYHDVLDNKVEVISRVAEFIKAPNSIDEAVAFVNSEQNRYKKEELVSGI